MRDDVAVAEAAVVAVEPEVAARDAGLRYVRDGRPGIRRELRGDSFVYIDPSGTTVDDAATLERIAALAIPLAYTDVWVCPSPNGHIQATGRDAAGRKQYRYHPRWRATRDETKYGRMLAFGRALPEIRAAVSRDLRRPGLSREKVVAAVVRLLELTLIRVGNDEYARTNDSYGLTTMYDDHVTVENSTITFAFRGKSGKFHDIALRDRRLATIVRSCRDLPGQELFQYLGDDGEPHDIGSDDVNSYLRAVSGQPFSAKDFRTLGWHDHRRQAAARRRRRRERDCGQAPDRRNCRGGGFGAWQHASGLPQVLHPSGGARSLSRWDAYRDDDPARQRCVRR